VLDLARGAHDGGLAVALHGLARARHAQDLGGQHLAELRRDLADLGAQVLDEAAAVPGVAQHRRCGIQAQRPFGHLAPFDERVLGVGDDLAEFESHGPSGACACVLVYQSGVHEFEQGHIDFMSGFLLAIADI